MYTSFQKDKLAISKNPTAALWLQYFEMVNLLRTNI
jgi:hypothetical protein